MASEYEALCPGCFEEKGPVPVCPHCGFDEQAARSPTAIPYRTLLNNQYLSGRVLGKPGGFGITYLGRDVHLKTHVAIKEFLPRDYVVRETGQTAVVPHSEEDARLFQDGLERFLQEAQTLARLDHPNIVRVRTFFEAHSTAYLVMDYYEGMSLEEYLLLQGGKLAVEQAVALMLPVLDGLREVHENEFLHRDIKPQNIYLRQGRSGVQPILLDFGAARQTLGEHSRSLSVVLTEGFAPPEQYQRRGEQGAWTDVYACAATLYYMVSGEAPPTAIELMAGEELMLPEEVSDAFRAAIVAALSVDISQRPQTAQAFQALLMEPSPVEERPAAEPVPPAEVVEDTAPVEVEPPEPISREPIRGADVQRVELTEEPAKHTPAPSARSSAGKGRLWIAAGLALVAAVLFILWPRNQPPVAVEDSATTAWAEAVEIAVLHNDRDPDGDSLQVSAVRNPEYGEVEIGVNGTVLYTPNSLDLRSGGVDKFGYVVSDGELSTTARVQITVEHENSTYYRYHHPETLPEISWKEIAKKEGELSYIGGNTLSLVEDHAGVMWIGTGMTLSRYDGAQSTMYASEDYPGDLVTALATSRGGSVWIGTTNGLSRYDGSSFTTFAVRDGLANNHVTTLSSTYSADGIWIGTYEGLSYYDGAKFTTFSFKDGLAYNHVTALSEPRDGSIWIGTAKGLSRYDGAGFTTFTVRDGLADDHVTALLESRDGVIWIGTRNGLSRYDGSGFTIFSSIFSSKEGHLVDDHVISLLESRDGVIWIGTFFGLSRYDGKQFESYISGTMPVGTVVKEKLVTRGVMVRDGLADGHVTGLLEKSDGSIWIGTEWSRSRKHLSRYDGKQFESYISIPEDTLPWIDYTDDILEGDFIIFPD